VGCRAARIGIGENEVVMARACEICGKKTTFGNNVSHAHNVTSRTWQPNLRRVRVRLPEGGTRHARICTRCLRGDLIQKAVS
jgi:large subunit ribosomal protein L28